MTLRDGPCSGGGKKRHTKAPGESGVRRQGGGLSTGAHETDTAAGRRLVAHRSAHPGVQEAEGEGLCRRWLAATPAPLRHGLNGTEGSHTTLVTTAKGQEHCRRRGHTTAAFPQKAHAGAPRRRAQLGQRDCGTAARACKLLSWRRRRQARRRGCWTPCAPARAPQTRRC
jgi:hypothetical protein